MTPWISLEELRGACNLDILTASPKDRELGLYLRAFQGYAEKFCARQFDGSISKTVYIEIQDATDTILLKNTPIISVASIYNDPDRNFGSSTLISSSDYLVHNDSGIIQLKNTSFLSGFWSLAKTSLKVTYTGGFIGEKTLVSAALPANGMTISDIVSYNLPFSLSVQTSGTSVAGNVTIIGLDSNGTAQTEVLAIAAAADRTSSQMSWTSVTTFNASAIANVTNTVKLVGNSFPEDFRTAACLHVAHLYQQDQDKQLNLTSRSVGNKSEAGYVKGLPSEVVEILKAYRRYS